jgi:hypothetical protein
VNSHTFTFGQPVKVVSGKYAGMTGILVDSATDSDDLPAPLPGHHWIRVIMQSISIPLHVRHDEIDAVN